ncbi:uncharacterized protein LOC103185592 [Callorhinchus milii]|uniref:uncharacterized protein LOC103185592 n=1 Tax=Callorhinchus milii TaxID=7868 RepID=UPI0004574E00|nr:uncharacterized protein LOC103185592 [Callorhinchus milii]|eukprot:gi/632971861/ref/XP_007902378.1/ PREDICTED: uncharacterized protein LOC103185592 isoform X2 [Callorhinchus milii]
MAAEDSQAVAKVTSGMMDLGMAEDVKHDLELIMKPYANWEEFLTPGPISIAILGELIFISAAESFKITLSPDRASEPGLLKHPESFHASLLQVIDQGWRAFNKAHKNMDQIRLYSLTAPKHLASAVQVLGREPAYVKAMLPRRLQSIKNIADECVQLSSAAEEEFSLLLQLIQELLEACAGARTSYQEKESQVQLVLKEAKLRKKSAEEKKFQADIQFTQMCKDLEEARKTYTKAVKRIPATKTLLGVYVTQTMLDMTNRIATELVTKGLCEPVSLAVEVGETAVQCLKGIKDRNKAKEGGEAADNAETSTGPPPISICLKAMEMLLATAALQHFLAADGSLDHSKLAAPVGKDEDEDEDAGICRPLFENALSKLETEDDCGPRKEALLLCSEGIATCKRLEEMRKQEKLEETETKQVALDIKDLSTKVRKFLSGTKGSSKAPSIAPTPLNLANVINTEKNEEGLAKVIQEEACFKVEQAKCQMDITKQEFDKMSEKKDQANKDLDEILVSMMKCEVKKIDFDETVKMLTAGLKALSEVKEQWAKMSNFFQMMSNLIKVSLKDKMEEFANESEALQAIPSYSLSSFDKGMIYTQVFHACSIANLCHMISGTYVEISQKYLRDQVSGLETHMHLSPSDPMFNVHRSGLQEAYKKAKEAIHALVEKNKQEFEMEIQQRIGVFNGALKGILPPAVE